MHNYVKNDQQAAHKALSVRKVLNTRKQYATFYGWNENFFNNKTKLYMNLEEAKGV